MDRLRSALGIVFVLGLAYALCPSERRRRTAWRPVLVGMAVLAATAWLVLKTPVRGFFQAANDGFESLLLYSDRGAAFVFGEKLMDPAGPVGFVFACRVLPTIVFFAALFSFLYYVRVLPFIVKWMGRALSRALGTSGAESFSTVADVFVGQTEAPLAIQPYLKDLTRSELNACMVAGFATTAGGVLAAYVGMLKDFVPDVAGHFIACSVLCAPASLVVAKLLLPETETPRTAGATQIDAPRVADNPLEAIAAGASSGLQLALNIGAMLIVFTAFTHLLNGLLGAAFGYEQTPAGAVAKVTMQDVLAKLFWPLAYATGVPTSDVDKVASLLGTKTVLNEFVAYDGLARALRADPAYLTERGRLIASYALCGFANFASIGIQIGGYAVFVPERRAELSRLALRAMFGGMLSTLLVACLVGAIL
jgi:CNT family concentrative nucleoside transporter